MNNSRLNLFAPDIRANPYPSYAQLRRGPALVQVDPFGLWAVHRHADIVSVLKNHQVFSCTGDEVLTRPAWLGRPNPFEQSMVMQDPPRHTRLRGLISRAFGPALLARLEPRLRAHVQRVTAELPANSPVNFAEAFSARIPTFVIGELLGLDASRHSDFRRWAVDMMAIGSTQEPERQAEIRASLVEMEDYLWSVLEDRRRAPREDLVSDLLAVNAEGEKLTDAELLAFMSLLFVAALEAPTNVLSNSALVLARHPDVLARLRADRSLIPRFVEEVLRYEPPSHAMMRFVRTETELDGVRLMPGTPLLLLLGSAFRDEAVYPEPERFDLDRGLQHNLTFGHGIHFCLGAALSRLETRVALEVLVERFQAVSLGAEPVQWSLSFLSRGPTVLSLTLQPA